MDEETFRFRCEQTGSLLIINMNTEFEIRFLNINESEFVRKMEKLGAITIKPKSLMRRETFDFPHADATASKKWGRVRDEGDKITITIKIIEDRTLIDGTNEVELIVNDFDKAVELMVCLGLKAGPYQENYRQEWHFNRCSITLDTWPGLKPFVEIEGKDKSSVEKTSKLLDFDISKGEFGSIDFIYEKVLGVASSKINNIPVLTFKNYNEVLK